MNLVGRLRSYRVLEHDNDAPPELLREAADRIEELEGAVDGAEVNLRFANASWAEAEARIAALASVVDVAKHLNDEAAKAVFEEGHEERLLIENWPLMDALAQFREAVAAVAGLTNQHQDALPTEREGK